MTAIIVRTIGSLAAIVTILAAAAAWQDNADKGAPRPAEGPELVAANCTGCHGSHDTPSYKEYKSRDERRAAEGRPLGTTEFIKLDEYHTWQHFDLHGGSFDNITPNGGDAGKANLAFRMQTILRRKFGADYTVVKDQSCLTCHATDRHPGPVEAGAAAAGRFDTIGVGCESCHGFAEKWIGEHFKESWRARLPAEKADFDLKNKPINEHLGYGLVDLRSPRVRAQKCASCHIGNKQEGKFVTHEMYAAGHPPLPAFELNFYADQEPPHYFSHQKNEELRRMESDWKNKKPGAIDPWVHFHYRSGEIACARDIAVGAVAAFGAGMDLLAKEAAAVKPDAFLDFAHFDCAACHHDLQYPSDRQKRAGGVPGRPLMKLQTQLLDVVLEHASNHNGESPKLSTELRARFENELAKLREAFDARPFGDPQQIKAHAENLIRHCDDILKEMDAVEYTPNVSRGLLSQISTRFQSLNKDGMAANYLDYDSAQQLTWAALALQKELGMAPADPAAREKLAKMIGLSFRDAKDEEGSRLPLNPVASRLPDRLKLQYDYQQKAFLQAIADWLPKTDGKQP